MTAVVVSKINNAVSPNFFNEAYHLSRHGTGTWKLLNIFDPSKRL